MSNQEQTHLCRRCGRKLRSEQAKRVGMGPVCHQKWLSEGKKRRLFEISSLHSSKDGV